jgi:hypothetical protein
MEGRTVVNLFENALLTQAHEVAETDAHEMAQHQASKLVQAMCAATRKAADNVCHLPTEKFIREVRNAAYELAYGLIYDAAYEETFRYKYASLVRDERRQKAAATKARKAGAKANTSADAQDLSALFCLKPEGES